MSTQARTSRQRERGRAEQGFSLIELLIVVAIILIVAAIAIPNMISSKIAANQASAVANTRTLTSAAVSYWVTYTDGYPASLATLGGAGGAATCDAADLVDSTIASAPNQKSGYTYAYTGEAGNVSSQPPNCGAAGFNGYLLTATPIRVGSTANISYCSAEPGIIHYDPNGATPPDPNACTALPTLQ